MRWFPADTAKQRRFLTFVSYSLLSASNVASSHLGNVAATASFSSAVFPAPSGTSASQVTRRREFWMGWARGGAPNSLVHSVPAASRRTVVSSSGSGAPKVQHVVSIKTRQLAQQIKAKIPNITPPPKDDTGFFYGLTTNMVDSSTTGRPASEKKPRPPNMREAVVLTLDEIRILREEMEALRKEVQSLKIRLSPTDSLSVTPQKEVDTDLLLSKEELENLYMEMGHSVEVWAARVMQEGVEDGWVEVKCNKVMRKTINPDGTSRAYLKWMKDSRGAGYANPKDDREYPCLKFSGVIDAPLDIVCLYLSREQNMPEYNDLIESHTDLQEITPSAKICLGQTPQILFIRPRSLVTYCQHRWLADGSQLVVSQACRHPKKLTKRNVGLFDESDGYDEHKQPMAFALRGVNHIGPCPTDPENKTRITLVAHGNPGNDVPSWAVKTAVGALANIEPFKLFHRINVNVKQKLPELQEELDQRAAQLVSERPDGRTRRPAGIAQLGYACFWPNGGGLVDSKSTPLTKAFELPSVSNNEADDENNNNNNNSHQEFPQPGSMEARESASAA
ncbi:hypothetical protein ACA910_001715 [Epithemia clementina (nom. ined.)]